MKELYKKDPNELDYYDDVVNHPEPDMLESKVKWGLGSTASGWIHHKLVDAMKFQQYHSNP